MNYFVFIIILNFLFSMKFLFFFRKTLSFMTSFVSSKQNLPFTKTLPICTGYWIQHYTGCRILDTGYSIIQDAGYYILGT